MPAVYEARERTVGVARVSSFLLVDPPNPPVAQAAPRPLLPHWVKMQYPEPQSRNNPIVVCQVFPSPIFGGQWAAFHGTSSSTEFAPEGTFEGSPGGVDWGTLLYLRRLGVAGVCCHSGSGRTSPCRPHGSRRAWKCVSTMPATSSAGIPERCTRESSLYQRLALR